MLSGPSAPVSATDGAGGVSREARREGCRIALVQASSAGTGGPGVGLSLSVAAIRTILVGSSEGRSAPLARVRPWGSLVAAAGLAGAGLGLRPPVPGSVGRPALPAARNDHHRPGPDESARRNPGRHRLPSGGRDPPGAGPGRSGHGGLAASGGLAPGRLAVVGRCHAPGGARPRAGPHPAAGLRDGFRGPAGGVAPLLSSAGLLDGRPAPVAAGARRRRGGGQVRKGAGPVPARPLAAGTSSGRTVPMLAGEGVPPGAGDIDQEDRHVA